MKTAEQNQGIRVEIRPYKLKELAALYKADPKTFLKWLLPFQSILGKRLGHYYNITQVKLIFKKLSHPTHTVVSDIIEE